MNVVKCKNGHFFDSDTYPTCPHCGAQADTAQTGPATAPITEEKSHKKGLFHFGEKKKTSQSQIPVSQVPEKEVTATSSSHNSVSSTPASVPSATPSVPETQPDRSLTLDMWQQNLVPQPEPEEPQIPVNPEPVAPEEPVAPVTPVPPTPQTSTLQAAVRQASATTEGKTMSFFSAMTAAPAAASPAQAAAAAPQQPIGEPVVGWLVCTSGKHFGESFCIGAGKNSIGRSASNRIVLGREDSVSREKHALIVYEPMHRDFYLQPGDASGLTYLNGAFIAQMQKLTARDEIGLGGCKLLFVPLCGPDFTWETYLKKE